jgi:uncharacterized protein YecT (DUF1311 family)
MNKLLVFLLCIVVNFHAYGKESFVIPAIDVSTLSARLKQMGVHYHEGVLECEEGAIAVERNRLHMPTLELLLKAKKTPNFYDDFVYRGGNSEFPSNLFNLVKNSKDQEYAKKIAKKFLCEKIDVTSRTLAHAPARSMGSMVAGGLELLSLKRIDFFDYKSAEVPRIALDCYFAELFFPENDVGVVCDPDIVDTPTKLKNTLSNELKINLKTATLLYKKIEDYVLLSDDEAGEFMGSCASCNADRQQGEVEYLIYQALTIFRTGRTLICKPVGDGENPCSYKDYEAGLLGARVQQTYEVADAELNKQWELLKKQSSTNERWKDVLAAQRAWVSMKLNFVKRGKGSSAAHADKVETFLTQSRSRTIKYVRELMVAEQQ